MLVIQKLPRIAIIAVIGTFFLAIPVFCDNLADTSTDETPKTSTRYIWQPTGTGDWQLPSNWTPARTAPASSDILIFDLGGAITATNVPTQTIGGLLVSGNTTVSIQSSIPVILTIAGGDGDDFVVASGSTLNSNGDNAITVALATGATGAINGSVTFSSAGSVAHRLTAIDANSVTFHAGAIFIAGYGFAGNPFGTTSLNSVIFAYGSTYVSIAGNDPFGATEPNSVVVFKNGSLFSLEGNATTSFSGRTYAKFELNYPGGNVFVTGSSALVMDDLTVTAGTLNLNVTGNPGHSIKGNVTTLQGTHLYFNPLSPGTLNLNGTTPQTFKSWTQGAGGLSTVVIDNPAGVTVSGGLSAGNLRLVNGVVTAGPENVGVWVIGTVTRANGYVNGGLFRNFSAPGSFAFDVGTENGYSPVTVNVTSGTFFPSQLAIKAVQSPQPNLSNPAKALSRYWTLYYDSHDITADLTFNYLDVDIPPTANESNFVIQRYNGGFTQPSGVIDTSANMFRVNGVTSFGQDWTLAEAGALLAPRTSFDFDGDGRADVSVFRSVTGAWYLQRSTSGFTGLSFGIVTDKIAPADFDGDGKTDVAVYRAETGTWYWLNSSNGAFNAAQFGVSEDLPTPGDYDGDGRADISVFRPSNGTWYRLNSSNGSFVAVQFGVSEDKPTIGDYDGDGRADIAVWRPSNGAWYRLNSSDGAFVAATFGLSTDLITPADFDGDGKTDIAVYRSSSGIWYWLNSSNGAFNASQFGVSEDIPSAADFDGDGRADISVFRPSNGTWYRLNSSNGGFVAMQFGTNGDRPTPAAFRF